jgi:hypothetical protein
MAMLFGRKLSEEEFASLREIGRSVYHHPIPDAHRDRLLELHLIYKLLGTLRITSEGRLALKSPKDRPLGLI